MLNYRKRPRDFGEQGSSRRDTSVDLCDRDLYFLPQIHSGILFHGCKLFEN